MAKKRALQDAVADPLTRKPQEKTARQSIQPRPSHRPRPGFWRGVATLCVGLIGGAILGRFVKWP